ncbi:hypothetical protein KUTeg_015251 [Tegillarca granosa]|uniref:Uncharacterized protein n=1 Tax=Tegillarca granosa TaxID=220873 RepID=A0ABQ9EUA9_TEGGR|nr:hypothetical protein KUTeg_015251 [Tegillarca granosa]
MIEDYMKKYSLEELIFGPGMPLTERSEVQKLAKKMDLKHEMRQQEGNAYLVLSKKMTPQEMATCLHQNGGISGKYSLVPVTQLPKSSSIEQEKRKYKRPGYDKLLEEVEDAKKPRRSSDENTRTQNNDSSINTTSTKRGKSGTRFSDSKPYSHDQTVTTNPILYSSASNTTTISTGHVTVSKAVIPPPGVAIPVLSTQPNYQALSTQPVVAVPHLVSQASSAILLYHSSGTPVSQVQRYTTPASTAVQVHASPNAVATTQPAVSSSFVFGLNQAPGIQPLVHQSVQNTPIVQQQVANSIPLGNTPTLNNQGIYVKGVQPVVQQPVSQVVQPVIRQLVPQPVPQPVPPVQNPQASTVPVHSTGVKYQSMPPIASSLPLQQTRPQVPASISQYPPQVVQQPTVQTNLATESQKLLMIQQEALEKMRAQTTQQIGNNMVPQPTQHLNQPVLNRMPPPVTMPIQPTANQMPIVVPVSNQTANRPVAPNFSVPPPNFRFPPPAVTSVVHSSVSSSTVGQTQSQISAELKTHTNPFVNISNQKKSSSTAVTSSIQINLLYKSGKNSKAPSKNQTLSSKSKATEQQKRRQAVLTTIDTSKNVSVDKSSSRPSSSNVSQTYSSAVNETTSKVLSSTTTTVAQEEIPKSNVQQLVEKALKVFGGTAELESALNTIKGISQEQNKTSVSGSMGGGILDSILKQRVKETKPTPEKNTATLILSSQPGAKSTIIKPAETKQTQSRNNDNKTPGANTEENKRNEQPLKTNEKYKRSILGVSGMLSHMRKQQEKEHKSAYEKFKETVVKPSEKEDKTSDDEPKDTQTRKPYDIQPSSGIGVKGILKQPGRVDNSVTDSQFKHYQRQTPNLRSYRQTNRDSPPENETSPRVEVFPRGKGVNELKVENNQAKPVLKSILKNKTASDIKEQKSEDYTDLNRKNDLYYSQFGFSKQDSSKSNLGRTQERIFGDSDKHDKDYQQSESEKNTPFWLHKSQGSNIESEYGRHTEPEIYHTKQSFESSTSFMKQKNEDNSRLSSYRNQFRDSTETYDREESSFKKASVIPGLDYVHSPSSDVDGEHLGGYESRPKPLMNVSNHSKPSGAHLGSSTMEKKPNEERFNAYDLDSLLGNKNKQNVHTGIPYTGNYTESSSEQFGQQTSLNSQKLSDTLKSIRDNYNQPNDGYYGNESNMNRPYHLSSDRQSSCYNPSFTVPSSRQDNSLGALPSLKQQFPFGFGVTNKSPSLQQNQSGFGSIGTSSSRFPGFQGNTMGIPSGIGREYGLPRFSSRQPTPSSSVSSTPSYMMDSLDNFTAESRAERKEKRF